ncbi:hypothetical protein IFM89_022098 [Coptis chinensis]|uniref:CCHC-type domain-containing protein n=1 Tax=Coptis chinensis TaxID=261450 RepID=A0A835IA53_9MAGN|nr:hypothetical protein IFM89_022098 [Coptis chinensis]
MINIFCSIQESEKETIDREEEAREKTKSVINEGPIERSTVPKLLTNGAHGVGPKPVHDLNVPYEPIEEYEMPTAEILYPLTPKQTLLPGTAHTPLPRTVQTPLLGSGENLMYKLPTPSDYSSGHENVTPNEVKPKMPSPYRDFFMMSYGQRKREDFAPHFHRGGYIPQQDGVGDGTYDVFQTEHRHRARDCQENNNAIARVNSNNGGYVTRDVSCYNCGNPCHRARECTAKESADGQGEGMAIWLGSVLMRTVAVLDAMVAAQVAETNAKTEKEVRKSVCAIHFTIALRNKLKPSLLHAFLNYALILGSEAHTRLSVYLPKDDEQDMEVDTTTSATSMKQSLPELEIYCYLLVLIFLIDQKRLSEAKACSSASIARLRNMSRRTVDVLASRLFFYYSLSYELTGDLAEIRGNLLALHRIATLRHDELGQETLLNLLLRNYLHYNLSDQAEKLRSKAPHFEAHSNQQFSTLSPIVQKKIADELDRRTPQEILKKLEDVRNKIILIGFCDVKPKLQIDLIVNGSWAITEIIQEVIELAGFDVTSLGTPAENEEDHLYGRVKC